MKNKFNSVLWVILCFMLFQVHAKSQSTPLDAYIEQALQHNGLIREQKLLIEEKQASLALEKKQFSPEINFGTSYTLALGGRTIAFPIGDLLNPINNTLNELTKSNKFGTFQNQTIQFLPNNFYDARVRISQPILRPEIKINESINAGQIKLQELQYNIVARDLVRDVKKAYYQYIQSGQLIAILNQGLVTLGEGERVTQSLIKNGVALPSSLLRLQSERSKMDQDIFSATQQRNNAREYFNYLLGRSGIDSITEVNASILPDPVALGNEIKDDELKSMDQGLGIQQLVIDLEKKYHTPRLGAQLDLGSQNFNFKPGLYALAGLQLEIPLWNNNKSQLKQKGIEANMQAIREKKDWIVKSYQLQVDQARRQVETANEQYRSLDPLLLMTSKYYTELLKKYKEGQATPAELIDASSQITYAQLQQNIAKYQSWINAAELERLLIQKK